MPEEVLALANKFGITDIFEVSAKENHQIEDVFFKCILNCVDS